MFWEYKLIITHIYYIIGINYFEKMKSVNSFNYELITVDLWIDEEIAREGMARFGVWISTAPAPAEMKADCNPGAFYPETGPRQHAETFFSRN